MATSEQIPSSKCVIQPDYAADCLLAGNAKYGIIGYPPIAGFVIIPPQFTWR